MTQPTKLENNVPLEISIPEGGVPLESILCTEELQRRPSRPPDYEMENRALVALVSALADSPSTIFQTLAETILDLTQCDSAGLSLLTSDGKTPDVCGQRFYWPAIAGMWNPHVGGGTPRNFGPCGDVLDCNRTLLFKHFERRYPYLQPVMPPAEECLLVPFYVGGKAVGTIWAIMHSDRHKFDTEDERVMTSLEKFASSAYQALESIDDLNVQVGEREKAETELRELSKGLETQVRARTEELKRRQTELLTVRDELAAELEAMTRLHELSTQLLATSEFQPLLEQVLDATIALQNADFGNIQLYNPETHALEIVAQRGFNQDFLEYFRSVGDIGAACGRAMELRNRVIIEDVETDSGFAPHRDIAASAGFRAVQSTPLVSPRGEFLGILSTHFRRAHRPSLHDLRFTDLYARHAAEIIERKRLEAARRQGEERYRNVVETATDAVVTIDETSQILFANRSITTIFGYAHSELIGESLTILMPEFMRELHTAGFQRYLKTGQKQISWRGVELSGRRKNGEEFPIEVSFGEVINNHQRVFTGFIRDITERKQADQERERLRQAQADLAHINRVSTMGELTASLAHEIKQPMFAAAADAETCLRWLARPQPDVAEAQEAALRLMKDVTRASDIINRIGSLFKKDVPKRELVDINELIREMIGLMRSEASRYSISIRIELADGLPQIMADRVGLQQVLMNLMLNGVEAMRDMTAPGTLTIVSRRSEDGQLTVSILDTGVGVPPERIDQIFSAFITSKPQGTGMGLPISRSIIESHGGRLWATSNTGPGAAFQFVLPIEPSAQQTA